MVHTTPSTNEALPVSSSFCQKIDLQHRQFFFDREQINLESHQLVWLGPLITLSVKTVRKVIDYTKVFDNVKECLTYIEKNKISTTIFLVIASSELGKLLIPQITDFNNIWSIIIYEVDTSHSEWISNYPKVCLYSYGISVHTHSLSHPNQLLCELKADVLKYKKYENNGMFNPFEREEDNSMDDANESWWITYTDVLIYLLYPNGFYHKLIDSLRNYYNGNDPKLKVLDKFEKEYKSDKAVWWYTSGTFIFTLFNRALRQHNIELIFLFGFFIQDLYKQLQTEYETFKSIHLTESRMKVYRGQIMSRKEINELDSNFIIVNNSLLSTSSDREPALLFLPESDQIEDSSYVRVLFELEINIQRQSRPYADIIHLSQFPHESEILFMTGTPFRIIEQNGVTYDENEKLWTVKLELTRDEYLVDNRIFESLTCSSHRLKKSLTTLSDSLQFASIENINLIFDNFCDLHSQEEKWINALRFHCIGRYQFWPANNLTEALSYYHKALQIWNNDSSYCSINIGQIYYDIALCYIQDAIRNSTLEEAPAELEQIDIYERLSELYMNTDENVKSIQYKERQVQFTLKYYSSIDEEKCAISLNSLGFLYKKIAEYDNALINYEKALTILL
ncbi:unnamed protein product, partial [Adineta ricciae]